MIMLLKVLLLSLVLTARTVISAAVKEETKSYICSKNQNVSLVHLETNGRCEESWDRNGVSPIAQFKNGPEMCAHQCLQVALGRLTLDDCVNITLRRNCPMSDGSFTETWIHFHPVDSPSSKPIVQPSGQPSGTGQTSGTGQPSGTGQTSGTGQPSGRARYGLWIFLVLWISLVLVFGLFFCITRCRRNNPEALTPLPS